VTLALLLLVLGLALIVAEVFLPSLGVLSVLATAAIVGALVLAFQEGQRTGVAFLVATTLLVPTTILLGFRIFPRTPFGKRMIPGGLTFESQASFDERDLGLAGTEGTLESPCRPAGVARLAGRRVDVVTRGEWLESGAPVRVLEVQGNRVVVTRIENG
jgi:membrane-bound serine protease (ClpP class)